MSIAAFRFCLAVSLLVVLPSMVWGQVTSYTVTATPDASLTSVTVRSGPAVHIFRAERLIEPAIVHFRSAGGVNVAFGSARTDFHRRDLLDRSLTSGVPNPGSADRPADALLVLDAGNPTPGVAVRFAVPVINRPGPDILVFELQKGRGDDPFHVVPLELQPGHGGVTIREYDLSGDSAAAWELPPVTLHALTAAPGNLEDFERLGLRAHSQGERGFCAAVASVDLSRLGYADGAKVEGLVLQSVAGEAAFDPVAVLGLPEPTAENLLAAEPAPEPFKPPKTELLQQVLDGPLAGCDEIVFAQRVSGRDHWYGNFGHYCENDSPYSGNAIQQEGDMRYAFGDGGRLCRLNLRTGELRVLLDDPGGGIRDPNVHYDGGKILFSYRKSGTKTYHLYEIDVDGSNLRQLTDGPDNDIEPIYTPDGGIVFCSSRCHRFVPCWRTQVATLYRCDADGGNIRMLSNNAEQENTPWMMSDGRILYMRWEYVDRHMMLYHHLWTINPDGTGVMVYFGNQHPGGVMIDAKPIPGSNKVVASFSPGHGRTEHEGLITIVDPNGGPDDMSRARKISSRYFRDPYPLSDRHFLVADREGLHLLADDGTVETIYQPDRQGARWDCHEPRPLRARPREAVIPHRLADEEPVGRLVLSDIYTGRNMDGVRRGEIKKLLVLEQLPRPANFSNGQEPLTVGGTFMLERIIGTVPVEEDGSAYMELPALRSLFFVALDENDLSVKRMQSFVTVQPGETTACVGCHEQRVHAPPSPSSISLAALQRDPSRPVPFHDVPGLLDFPRDIQPILDRHCVACHNADRRDGQVDLSGDHTPYFTAAYWTMFTHSLVVDGRNSDGNRAPRTIGSSASRLMSLLDGSHYEAKLSERERTTVRLWIESGAVYPGTYGALGSGIYTVQFPEATIERRCAACHQRTEPAYRNPKAGAIHYQFGKREPQHPLMSDPYDIILIRHLAYFQLGEAPLHQALCNLDQPQKSLLLQAPLSTQAGGLQLCGQAVFQDASDPDYQDLLAAVSAASGRLAAGKRFDMPGFRPNRYYLREMQHFGVLPSDLPADSPIDTYTVDRAYWQSVMTLKQREEHIPQSE